MNKATELLNICESLEGVDESKKPEELTKIEDYVKSLGYGMKFRNSKGLWTLGEDENDDLYIEMSDNEYSVAGEDAGAVVAYIKKLGSNAEII